MNTITVGTCSICHGPVMVPQVWMSILPPTPTCGNCGAVAATHGPIIPMRPQRYRTTTGASITLDATEADPDT
jgi:hypothetical protein